ncbi:hypothetical protein M404DRAFT_991940 [Pisolithus tinctorius Marx 270]|uniref:Uncharacterized protein n=1 Tax=Pisolithus tinctorius Marx 270 TaxID=870435 RepID=A0A0C3PLP3_PISTI|nr:hypothetical protein M404DRAFT_991940 [Pisolithus tinctorius Marx 270]
MYITQAEKHTNGEQPLGYEDLAFDARPSPFQVVGHAYLSVIKHDKMHGVGPLCNASAAHGVPLSTRHPDLSTVFRTVFDC